MNSPCRRLGAFVVMAVCMTVLAMALLLPAASAQAQVAETSPQALAELLEDDASRQALIEALRRQAENVEAPSDPGSTVKTAAASLPRQLAEATTDVVSDIGQRLEQTLEVLTGLVVNLSSSGFDREAFLSAAYNLGIVIIATVAIFVLLRRLSRPLYTRISQWSLLGKGFTPVLRLIFCVALAVVIDSLIVGLAYVSGNLIATFAVGTTGELSTRASLFMNAFLIIELIKVAIRMLFSSRYEGLRLLPISAPEASYWNRWAARLVGLVGYGLMVGVPLANVYLAAAVGQALGTLVMVLAFIYAVTVVLKNRERLKCNLEQMSHDSTMLAGRLSLGLFARTWHLLALAYFLMVFVLTLTRPGDALPFVLMATIKSLAALVGGLLLSSFISQTIGNRIRLSDELRHKLPLLERRLNQYVPNALRLLRTLIVIAVIMVVLDAWGAFDLAGWYASSAGRWLVGNLISVSLILGVSIGIWVGLASLIEHKLNPDTGRGQPSARAVTLLTLFRNALAIAIVTITGMIVLAEIGINIGPLIAGAGVLGLAIGFGAQKLVQDVITGIFIQVENAMNTGDVVTVGGITGTAEKLSIRSVGIRDLSGTYHIVPFSSVDTVSNYMREYGNHVGEYGIAYRENIDEAIEQLHLAFEDLKACEVHAPMLLDELNVPGVSMLADSSVNIRAVIKATPGNQWAVGRAYNRLVKMRFDQAGIEIPFPHTTLYFGEDKQGKAPAANLKVAEVPARQMKAEAPEEESTSTPATDRARDATLDARSAKRETTSDDDAGPEDSAKPDSSDI